MLQLCSDAGSSPALGALHQTWVQLSNYTEGMSASVHAEGKACMSRFRQKRVQTPAWAKNRWRLSFKLMETLPASSDLPGL